MRYSKVALGFTLKKGRKVKESLKAKRLQTQIAIDVLTGKIPKQARVAPYVYQPNVWHLDGKRTVQEAHCQSCKCFGYAGQQETLRSVCGAVEWKGWTLNIQRIPSRRQSLLRPCKRCLSSLNVIAKSEK
jgi:hypothetical protein